MNHEIGKTIELDSEITIPQNKKLPLEAHEMRFSDPKFAYHPKHEFHWKKQTFAEQKAITPIGKMSQNSWKFIVKNGTSFEESGMTTIMSSIIPQEKIPKENNKNKHKNNKHNKHISKEDEKNMNYYQIFKSRQSLPPLSKTCPTPNSSFSNNSIKSNTSKTLSGSTLQHKKLTHPRTRLGFALHIQS